MAEPISPTFQRLQNRLMFATGGIHLGGALVSFLYFQLIDPFSTPEMSPQGALGAGQWAVFAAVMVFTLGSTYLANRRMVQRLGRWYTLLEQGAAGEAPLEVRSLALNYVPTLTLTALLVWLAAGSIYAALVWLGGEGLFQALRVFVGIALVGGVLTSALYYLVADELIWRRALPVYFPRGRLSAAPAFRLTVFWRLMAAFLLVGVWLEGLLGLLTLRRAQMLQEVGDPRLVLRSLVELEVFVLGFSLVVSVGLAVLVTRSITDPLRLLQGGMSRVENHDFDVRLPVTTNDELGFVTEGFNDMTSGLRQGERLRSLLNLYVTPEVAQAALQEGAHLGGAQVVCTTLFADIRDFTGLSERLPPDQLIRTLNLYMGAMVAVIVAEGGMVNKFGGDSLLAVFGTPLNPAEDHAARAVRAAFRMRARLAEFNIDQQAGGRPTLRAGIGMATGLVVAGNMGGEERVEYTVIGDAVNLAARLQELTKELGHPALLSAETFTQARRYMEFPADPLPPVEVRGKAQPVGVYALRDS